MPELTILNSPEEILERLERLREAALAPKNKLPYYNEKYAMQLVGVLKIWKENHFKQFPMRPDKMNPPLDVMTLRVRLAYCKKWLRDNWPESEWTTIINHTHISRKSNALILTYMATNDSLGSESDLIQAVDFAPQTNTDGLKERFAGWLADAGNKRFIEEGLLITPDDLTYFNQIKTEIETPDAEGNFIMMRVASDRLIAAKVNTNEL